MVTGCESRCELGGCFGFPTPCTCCRNGDRLREPVRAELNVRLRPPCKLDAAMVTGYANR